MLAVVSVVPVTTSHSRARLLQCKLKTYRAASVSWRDPSASRRQIAPGVTSRLRVRLKNTILTRPRSRQRKLAVSLRTSANETSSRQRKELFLAAGRRKLRLQLRDAARPTRKADGFIIVPCGGVLRNWLENIAIPCGLSFSLIQGNLTDGGNNRVGTVLAKKASSTFR